MAEKCLAGSNWRVAGDILTDLAPSFVALGAVVDLSPTLHESSHNDGRYPLCCTQMAPWTRTSRAWESYLTATCAGWWAAQLPPQFRASWRHVAKSVVQPPESRRSLTT
eukprot:3103579-Amphidinium_carterae.1